MLKIFDTHTHYDDEAYSEDKDELISSMLSRKENGVAGFIAIGCSMERSRLANDIAQKYQTVYGSIGVHPDECYDLPDDYLNQLRGIVNSKTVAVGEIGLDYYYEGHDRLKQIKAFREQLELAKELSLPVIIHSRDATKDTMDILHEYKPRAVMHCYSGSAETARELVDMGIMLSFTGVLTFKNAKRAIEAAKAVPLEMLLLETDCPYMAPTPFRGKRCDSSMTWYIAQKLAEIKGKTTDEVVFQCNENAKTFFGIDF